METQEERLLIRVEDAARLLQLARSQVYAMLATGQLPVVRVGRAVRVPVDGLRNWIKRQTVRAASADENGA